MRQLFISTEYQCRAYKEVQTSVNLLRDNPGLQPSCSTFQNLWKTLRCSPRAASSPPGQGNASRVPKRGVSFVFAASLCSWSLSRFSSDTLNIYQTSVCTSSACRYELSEKQLRGYFVKFGVLSDLYLPKHANGRNKGYGFATFAAPESLALALQQPKHIVNGITVQVYSLVLLTALFSIVSVVVRNLI